MKICAATGNAGKLRELRRILEAQGHEVVSQKELGITIEPDETGTTFEENALIKAETICKASGLPTIADDSGLCVDAQNGALFARQHNFFSFYFRNSGNSFSSFASATPRWLMASFSSGVSWA